MLMHMKFYLVSYCRKKNRQYQLQLNFIRTRATNLRTQSFTACLYINPFRHKAACLLFGSNILQGGVSQRTHHFAFILLPVERT